MDVSDLRQRAEGMLAQTNAGCRAIADSLPASPLVGRAVLEKHEFRRSWIRRALGLRPRCFCGWMVLP